MASSPGWTPGRPFGCLDATRAPKNGAHHAFRTAPPARHSTRGQPARPPVLDAPPAPATPAVYAALDPTGLPAPAARGAGALPPGWLPVPGGTSGRLGPPAPTGSPQGPASTRWGGCDFRGGGQDCPCPTTCLTACCGPPPSPLATARLRLATNTVGLCAAVQMATARKPRRPALAQNPATYTLTAARYQRWPLTASGTLTACS